MYLYVAKEKIAALDVPETSFSRFFTNLSFALTVPNAEARAGINLEPDLHRKLTRIEKTLEKQNKISALADAGATSYFGFDFRSFRAVEEGAYLIGGMQGSIAVLLLGSPANAIGASPPPSNRISVSVDPIGALQEFVSGGSPDGGNISAADGAGFVWSTFADPVRGEMESLPRVEGIAVYAGRFKGAVAVGPDPAEKADLVVGSPLFVRQP